MDIVHDLMMAHMPFSSELSKFGEPYGLSLEIMLVLTLAVIVLIPSLFSGSPKAPIALDAVNFQPFTITEIEKVSPDTKRFVFALQSEKHVLGLPYGQHISFKFKDAEGIDCIRSYTPITSNDEIGRVEFIIKVYYPNVHPKFPAGGKMTMYLENLKVGDKVLMRGPKGNVDYSPSKFGSFTITKTIDGKKTAKPYNCKKLCFIAGGSGITPCLQIIREVLKGRSKGDTTKLWLLYANQTEKDILLRDELDALAADPSNELNIHYTLDRPPAGWAYSSGFITQEMCEKALPPADDKTFVFMCGPPPMIKFACEPSLRAMKYEDAQWHSF